MSLPIIICPGGDVGYEMLSEATGSDRAQREGRGMTLPLIAERPEGLIDLKCLAHRSDSDGLAATLDQGEQVLRLFCRPCGRELWAIPVDVETLIQFKGGR